MWLCLCLWALRAARFTNYSCCGVALAWEVRSDKELEECLSKVVLSLVFRTLSFPFHKILLWYQSDKGGSIIFTTQVKFLHRVAFSLWSCIKRRRKLPCHPVNKRRCFSLCFMVQCNIIVFWVKHNYRVGLSSVPACPCGLFVTFDHVKNVFFRWDILCRVSSEVQGNTICIALLPNCCSLLAAGTSCCCQCLYSLPSGVRLGHVHFGSALIIHFWIRSLLLKIYLYILGLQVGFPMGLFVPPLHASHY